MEWLAARFELQRAGAAHIGPMEGMRGFAVTLVFLVHYVTQIGPWIEAAPGLGRLAGWLNTIGGTGVDLFFVLSGFLIYGALMARAQPFVHFMRRRVQRIYPTFSVVFIGYAALSLLLPAFSKLPAERLPATLYLVENFLLLPGIWPVPPMITVAWSLSYEMLFYLLLPLTVGVLSLRQRRAAWRIACFAAIGLLILGAGPVRSVMFVAGVMLSEAMDSRLPTPGPWLATGAAAGGLLSSLLPLPGPARAALLCAAFFVLCLACFRRPRGWPARVFGWTPLRWLGNMSYSYYLLHGLVLKAGFLALGAVWPATGHPVLAFVLLLPLMFGLTLGPAAALFLAVERPCSLAPRRPLAATCSRQESC